MEKETHILVPIDFSTCSETALIFAMRLASKIKASLQFLNVLTFEGSDLENAAFVADEIEKLSEKTRVQLIKFIQNATENAATPFEVIPPFQTSIEIGRVEATVCDAASRNQADYIIMGTQGENSTLDKYLGSVASNVLKYAPCPVFVIPENTKLEENVVMGYATDFLDADTFEIWKAMKLFKPFQPQIKCVHFNEKDDSVAEKIKELETYFAETNPEFKAEFYSFQAKDKVEDMNSFIERQHINLLIMYKPKRTFWESLFHNSYTQKMARHTNIPLLVFKES